MTSGLALEPVDSGLDFSVFVTAPPGDRTRVMIVQRDGRVLLRKNGVRQDSAFINLSALTDPPAGSTGSIASPSIHSMRPTHRLFAYYAGLNGSAELSEFQADPDFDHADPTSRIPILTQTENPTTVLYGGTVAFGPDGLLYLGLGDGHATDTVLGTAQDSASLLGKILRLDVDGTSPYEIPADNPYVARAGWRGEIWQLGLPQSLAVEH